MKRLDFLKHAIRTAAGLYIAPDALEAILEPRRKLWPGASFAKPSGVFMSIDGVDLSEFVRKVSLQYAPTAHWEMHADFVGAAKVPEFGQVVFGVQGDPVRYSGYAAFDVTPSGAVTVQPHGTLHRPA